MKIIFFDGNCPMCHGWVKRLIKWDRKKVFKFAPLESDTAREMLSPILPEYLKEDTIVYYEDGKAYMRSDAALHIAARLAFPFNMGIIGTIIPKGLRDGVYKWVAGRRYKWGQRYDSCPLPPKEWRDRFLN